MQKTYKLENGDVAMSPQTLIKTIRLAVDAGKRIGYQNAMQQAVDITRDAVKMLDGADVSLRSVFFPDQPTHTNPQRSLSAGGSLTQQHTTGKVA